MLVTSSWEHTNTYQSLAFLIMYIALYLQGGITLVPPVKLVIGNMHYRGMEFGGAHVWKMSHPQAMEFFHTEDLGPCTLELCTQYFPEEGRHQLSISDYFSIFLP